VDRCALFVDAGYVLSDGAMAVHGTRHRDSVSWDYAGLLKLLASLSRDRTGLPVLRCYWYEATVDSRRTSEHDALADLPGLKLRLGKMRPGRREGVETEIHRDLTALARNGAVKDAVIISAEEDLAPVVAEVQDLGIRVVIVHIAVDGNWTISRPLRQECDDIIEISGAHLRPFVDLISGAEPIQSDEQYASSGYHSRNLPDGHSRPAGALTHRGFPAAALPAAPSALYAAPLAGEYQRAAQQPAPAASASQAGHELQVGSDSSQPAGTQGPDAARNGQGMPGQALPGSAGLSGLAGSRGHASGGGQTRGEELSRAADRQAYPSPESARGPAQSGSSQTGLPQSGPPQTGQPQNGLQQNGPPQTGLPQNGLPQRGLPQAGLPQAGLPQRGLPQNGPPQHGPPQTGLPQNGLSQNGPHQNGLPQSGLSQSGPQQSGLPQRGLPQSGLPQNGPQQPGLQQSGLPQNGLPQNGPQQPGLQQSGLPQNGLPQNGLPQNGPQQPGLQQSGLPQNGLPLGDPQQTGLPQSGTPQNGLPPSGLMGTEGTRPAGPHRQPGGGAGPQYPQGPAGPFGAPDQGQRGQYHGSHPGQHSAAGPGPGPAFHPPAQGPYSGPQSAASHPPALPPVSVSLADAVQAAHVEGFGFGEAVARDAPALWLEAVLARKPRMPSDLEARLLQGSALPIDSLLHDEVRHALRRGFWDALERSRR